MNAEFIEKMLEAKRLEAQAVALLVPPQARQVAAAVVRACSDTALEVLGASDGGSAQRAHTAPSGPRYREPRSIVIE